MTVQLGLRENLAQFSLLVAVAAAVSGLLASHYAARDALVGAGAAIAVIALAISAGLVRDTAAHVAVEQARNHPGADSAPPPLRHAFRDASVTRHGAALLLEGRPGQQPQRRARVGPGPLSLSPMQWRDREGVETAAIAALVALDGKRVLEVGCGGGRLTRFAAERAAHVYAFDPVQDNVAAAAASLATELRDRVRFAVHDAEALDVERRRFDVALCGWSL